MGLIASQPDDPTEWAGLPSEPLGPLPATEILGDLPTSDVLLGETPPGAAWVEIPAISAVAEPAGDDSAQTPAP